MTQKELDEILYYDCNKYINLTDADLRGANLVGVKFANASLRRANLTDADLTDADLKGANLRGANLRGVKFSPEIANYKIWMNNHFEFNTEKIGWIVYKTINEMTPYNYEFWKKFGKPINNKVLIEKKINIDRRENYEAGINFATKKWCIKEYGIDEIWKCLVPIDDNIIIVPFGTDGKARAEKIILLERSKQ
jgi:hypothetical protein